MISLENAVIINQLLKLDNIDEFIETLVTEYATNADRTSKLLSLIPKLAETNLKFTEKRVTEYSNAVTLLIGEHSIQQKHFKKCDPRTNTFPLLLYTSKAYFPNGTSEGASTTGKEFFQEFIDLIKNKVGFDYESSQDWHWICTIAQCRDYMIQVIKKNIDEEFKEPDIKKGC